MPLGVIWFQNRGEVYWDAISFSFRSWESPQQVGLNYPEIQAKLPTRPTEVLEQEVVL